VCYCFGIYCKTPGVIPINNEQLKIKIMNTKKKDKNFKPSRPERDIILEYVALPNGRHPRKSELAAELNLSLRGIQERVRKFKLGYGVGRKIRSDKGIPKKDPDIKTRLEFFAELAMGSTADEAQDKLKLSKHQADRLSKEFAKVDKWKALRNAPQLKQLKDLLKEILRFDIALVTAEAFGGLQFEAGEHLIEVPIEELNDIRTILAHCMQRNKMGEIDPMYKNISKDQLEKLRVYYLKEDLLENKDVKSYASLHRAVKVSTPEKQLDLKLVYAVIDRFSPGKDETEKIKIIKEEFEKLKLN